MSEQPDLPDAWEGVPYGPAPDRPGWAGGWAHPELREWQAAIEERLEGHRTRAQAGGDIEQLLAALQRAGVTRYKRGDLEIELSPAAPPGPVVVGRGLAEALHEAVPPKPPTSGFYGDSQPADDGPEEAPEAASPSGLAVDHEALAERLAQRRRALERGKTEQ